MADLAKRFGRITELAAQYDEYRQLEKWHRAPSRRQYHAATKKKLDQAKRRLKSAVAKL